MAEKRKVGRPSIGDKWIQARVTTTQHLKFLRLGGSAWLRNMLDNKSMPKEKAK